MHYKMMLRNKENWYLGNEVWSVIAFDEWRSYWTVTAKPEVAKYPWFSFLTVIPENLHWGHNDYTTKMAKGGFIKV